jgi:hypothetical protein
VGSRAVTTLGYLAFVAAGVVLEVLARRPGSRVATARALLGRAMRSRAGRLAVVAGWAWVGLHFFAR